MGHWGERKHVRVRSKTAIADAIVDCLLVDRARALPYVSKMGRVPPRFPFVYWQIWVGIQVRLKWRAIDYYLIF